MIPDEYADLLSWDARTIAHVATVGPKGEPQTNPIWFEWTEGEIRFSQTTARQKYRNIGREPRVAISVIDPTNPYRYLEVRGTVTAIDPDPDKAFIDRMASKYMGQDSYPWHQPDEERVVVRVTPEHTTSMG